jgi:hypothetical protein
VYNALKDMGKIIITESQMKEIGIHMGKVAK